MFKKFLSVSLMTFVFSAAGAADYVTVKYPDVEDFNVNDQGFKRIQQWGNNNQDQDAYPEYVRYRAYHGTMGTQLLPVNWFAALETDDGTPLPQVAPAFGFLPSDAPPEFSQITLSNGKKLDLPIGFAISNDPKAGKKFGESQWLGLNCAGCHTTKLNIKGKDVIIDGNATMFRLNQFEFALADIVNKTLNNQKRYIKFRNKVMGLPQKTQTLVGMGGGPGGGAGLLNWRSETLHVNFTKFAKGFSTFLKNNHTRPDGSHVEFSPGSVDALTLGGNMAAGCNNAMWEANDEGWNALSLFVSRDDFYEEGNCQAADVPVNIPHIWGTNNFAGGHYAAEETNVTGRNFGAAMTGFGANRLYVKPKLKVDLTFFDDTGLISLDRDNLLYPETSIKLKDLNKNQKWYDTLKAPTWQGLVDAGVVDPMSDEEITQANLGKELYNTKCSTCHGLYTGEVGKGGKLTYVEESSLATDKKHKHLKLSEPNAYGAQFWNLVRVPTEEIGTDTARNDRDGVESNKTLPKLLVDKFNELFSGDPTFTQLSAEERTVPARFYRQFWVLATLRGQLQNEQEQKQAFVDDTSGVAMLMGCRDINELRKNIVVADAYKARPLDGIVFTAPYLHNGSVPTLWDLFSPSDKPNQYGEKRPATFEIGCTSYDVEKMGFDCDSTSSDLAKSQYAGAFDIKRFGQSNKGHEGEVDQDKWGDGASYGTDLSPEQKTQLISFLKTLESMEDPNRGICEMYTYPE